MSDLRIDFVMVPRRSGGLLLRRKNGRQCQTDTANTNANERIFSEPFSLNRLQPRGLSAIPARPDRYLLILTRPRAAPIPPMIAVARQSLRDSASRPHFCPRRLRFEQRQRLAAAAPRHLVLDQSGPPAAPPPDSPL